MEGNQQNLGRRKNILLRNSCKHLDFRIDRQGKVNKTKPLLQIYSLVCMRYTSLLLQMNTCLIRK